jgi:hypothetical protein
MLLNINEAREIATVNIFRDLNTSKGSVAFNSGEPIYIGEDLVIPTAEEINIKTLELEAEYEANAYARSRKTAYDALNQLELISDDAINGTTTHADAILAIKAEIPKPV